jgi:hypothetical protein
MPSPLNEIRLQAFLDEALPAEEMSYIEQQLRTDPKLHEQLQRLIGQREAGVHSIGEIWRRNRISCPTRQQLGAYLLKALPSEQSQYVEFHLNVIQCRCCSANLEDLRRQRVEDKQSRIQRSNKYFQSSIGKIQN